MPTGYHGNFTEDLENLSKKGQAEGKEKGATVSEDDAGLHMTESDPNVGTPRGFPTDKYPRPSGEPVSAFIHSHPGMSGPSGSDIENAARRSRNEKIDESGVVTQPSPAEFKNKRGRCFYILVVIDRGKALDCAVNAGTRYIEFLNKNEAADDIIDRAIVAAINGCGMCAYKACEKDGVWPKQMELLK